MHAPSIKFLVSSPYGDVPVDTDRLDLPLECDPLKTPYRVYFQSIRDFLEKNQFMPILKATAEKCGEGVHIKDVNEIIVRTEKHGSLYHPASIEIILKETKMKFGLNVAITETGREWLQREFGVIRKVNAKFNLPYLPCVYFFDELNSMSFLLEGWFEGYHEFHLSLTESGKKYVKLWEYGKGYAYLSREQSFEIYRQASKILTLYYDINDFSQIFPWHQAAGDFIARVEGDGIDLRLTTARQYEPHMVFQEKEGLNTVLALFFFLLNLALRMRLDKLDGLGDTVWAEDFCLEASVQGFIDGLKSKKEFNNLFTSENEFFGILKSFRVADLKNAYEPLIDIYNGTADYPVITANLENHAETLHAILQNFPS